MRLATFGAATLGSIGAYKYLDSKHFISKDLSMIRKLVQPTSSTDHLGSHSHMSVSASPPPFIFLVVCALWLHHTPYHAHTRVQ